MIIKKRAIKKTGLKIRILLLSLIPLIWCSYTSAETKNYHWLKQAGKVSLSYNSDNLNNGADSVIDSKKNNTILWSLNYGKNVAKPYFHPLSLADGTIISRYKPHSDEHPWHKGLWFSLKYINGVNYWEEKKSTGHAEGLTIVIDEDIKLQQDFSAHITLTLAYQNPKGKNVLIETREMRISAPNHQQEFTIDWRSNFVAQTDLVLDRTPLAHEQNGKPWGGYAGLSMRIDESLIKPWHFISSNQDKAVAHTRNKAIHRSQQRWVYAGGSKGGFALFDHPNNSENETYWYVNGHYYYSPAFLHQRSQSFKAGETFQLQYQATLYNTPQTQKSLQLAYKNYLN